MTEQVTQEQQAPQEQVPPPMLNLTLSVPEVNQILAGLENYTKPLIQKIVEQAQQQLNK